MGTLFPDDDSDHQPVPQQLTGDQGAAGTQTDFDAESVLLMVIPVVTTVISGAFGGAEAGLPGALLGVFLGLLASAFVTVAGVAIKDSVPTRWLVVLGVLAIVLLMSLLGWFWEPDPPG